MNKKILITGATGLIGRKLVTELCRQGAFVRILTTNTDKAKIIFEKQYTVQAFEWKKHDDPLTLTELIEDSDVIINLAGANLGNQRWTSEYMEEIYNSRIEITKLLVQTIRISKKKPNCLVNASAVGIYGFSGNQMLTEDASLGDDYLAKLCRDWETEAMKAIEYNVRVVTIRTGIVLEKNEGALKEFLTPFKFFAGVYQGNGKQSVSWIHIDDILALYLFVIENTNLFGAVNGCAPLPVTNKQFIKTIGKILNKKILLPVPGFILRIVVGKFSKNLLTGQYVYPKKVLDEGFVFKYPDLESALKDLLKKE